MFGVNKRLLEIESWISDWTKQMVAIEARINAAGENKFRRDRKLLEYRKLVYMQTPGRYTQDWFPIGPSKCIRGAMLAAQQVPWMPIYMPDPCRKENCAGCCYNSSEKDVRFIVIEAKDGPVVVEK